MVPRLPLSPGPERDPVPFRLPRDSLPPMFFAVIPAGTRAFDRFKKLPFWEAPDPSGRDVRSLLP